ncbi:hypothetical protein B0H17DRAFT_1302090 [Mycena rosella]|uniref:Uncharacterized protein n=1 Tax=Mycena rosella TaxID=1033263 RepID=A0AAD7DB56_MYCRO|nr:hypothetical protein B0H17DRAFT_1302090 [Mycena rosella]
MLPLRNSDYLNHNSPPSDNFGEEIPPDEPEERAASPAQAEDIKRVFHPHSGRQVVFQSFDDYVASTIAERPPPTDPQPWRPFRTQLDFELAEFCEQSMLNRDYTETLISFIRRCMFNPDDFTLKTQRELDELWELASHKCTAFEKGTVTIQYKKEDKTYDTYTRPLWDWARGLLQDPGLASCFVWDAEKVYKFNGESYVRFYHEPWTADAWWAAQSGLPDAPAAKPVCYFLYADKSKLSSFGTEKAYAVVARLANVPIAIRNGTRFGGGQVVGHQPIVKGDTKEDGKPAFANFKNIVWHTAFYKLLESLVHAAKVGDWTACGDGVLRWLWPRILILAADYEEACMMALIRGLMGLYPCPICFVPWNEQSDLTTENPLRTGTESQEILKNARAQRLLREREEILKDHGLRDIDNVFWNAKGSDPHEAISYDPLHADDSGFWNDHLFKEIKERATELGRAEIAKIDAQYDAFPRWRNLNHFDGVMNKSFNDGSKHEDIAKMMLFVAHNIFIDNADLLLLQALRCYLDYRTSLSYEVHTTETIAEGRREVLALDSAMKEYISACEGSEKNWNFPKFHARVHAFDDIEKKGATRNFGTKPSEAMHGPIRQTYSRLTNFKDVTPQASLCLFILVKNDHRRTVATFIREQIEALEEDEGDAPEDLEAVLSNVDIGSKLKVVSYSALEQAESGDPAFHRFRLKFGDFISDFLPAYGYKLPGGQRLRFDDTDTIVPFQFLKVHYESLSSWTSTTDYLRCNPKFQGHPRYDCVLINTADKPIFAKLLFPFSCTVEKKSHPFVLVLPMDAPIGHRSRKDKLLGLRRVKEQARKKSEFISVHSIIRGAVLVPDVDKPNEFLVFDILDADMKLRLKRLYPRTA